MAIVQISGILKEHIEVDYHQNQVTLQVETSLKDRRRHTVIVPGILGKALAHSLQRGQVLSVQGRQQGNSILAEWIRFI